MNDDARPQIPINAERLLDDLNTLRSFGADGTGVVRPTFSEIDMASRRWLRERMEEAGQHAVIDGVGNVFGRSPNPGPALVIGSHSDTQPEGGWLDGAMGVIYAIEVARALRENPATQHLAIDTVAWSDEEATYTSCLGAHSFVNELTKVDLAATNAQGESVSQALARVNLTTTPPVRFEPDRHTAYLEAHIEQGPHLEAAGNQIGIVTSIVGIRVTHITFTGEQNHAGTTPMALRKDAAQALFAFGSQLQERMPQVASDASVWTIGHVQVSPGAESIIPGHAEATVQFRDPDDNVLAAMEQMIRDVAAGLHQAGPVDVSVVAARSPIAPTVMDPGLRSHLMSAAIAHAPGAAIEMPSAAGHDPMVLAHHLRCAMLFIPSIGGVSHDFAEDSHPADIVAGCQVLTNAAASILFAAPGGLQR